MPGYLIMLVYIISLSILTDFNGHSILEIFPTNNLQHFSGIKITPHEVIIIHPHQLIS